MSTAFHHMKFKEELAKKLIRQLYGEDALAELEAFRQMKERRIQQKTLAAVAREMKIQELKEKMDQEALPEAAKLDPELETFLSKFGEKFDAYQEQIKSLQLQLVRSYLATEYLQKALGQLEDVEKKIRDMQRLKTVQDLEEKISALAQRQRELVRQIREKIAVLREELEKVNPQLFSRKPIESLQAKADLEALSLLLEAELGQTKDQVERTFHHPLPAEPASEEQEVEEVKTQGKSR